MTVCVCVFRLQIVNQGKVKFEYSFQVCMDSSTKTAIRDQEGKCTVCGNVPSPRTMMTILSLMVRGESTFCMSPDESITSRSCSRGPAESTEARPASALASVISLLTTNAALPPFTIEPSIGTVEPGAVQNYDIRFAPQEVAQFEGRLVCR